tara:strand:+ start:287 stop:994 length:708 start_codon:yes stop_codon:yes gene_type:complete
MKYLINYADGGFHNSRVMNSITGLQAGFDSVLQYNKTDISEHFFEANKSILTEKRGAGYWLWKPYFILKTLQNSSENDIVFYSDSGAKFIKHMEPLFRRIKDHPKGVVVFEMSGHHKENEYSRKSVIEEVAGLQKQIAESDQRMASFIGLRNCSDSCEIIEKWLNLCTNKHLILDLPRQSNEFETFKDHRHDQSLWSLLTKKLKLEAAPDPSQWGLMHKQTTEKDVFIDHHRENK